MSHFVFKVIGGPPSDPGLSFSKLEMIAGLPNFAVIISARTYRDQTGLRFRSRAGSIVAALEGESGRCLLSTNEPRSTSGRASRR